MSRPTLTFALALGLGAIVAPGLARAQPACSHETRCPAGQSWDETAGRCTVPLSS